MSASLSLQTDEFLEAAQRYLAAGESVEDAVNEVLHGMAGEAIYRRINPLIHPSGRTFKGHSASATASEWPLYDTSEDLAVTVRSRSRFHYLYFPDDGSNTRRHAGGQHFMERGAEAAADEISGLCLENIINRLEM